MTHSEHWKEEMFRRALEAENEGDKARSLFFLWKLEDAIERDERIEKEMKPARMILSKARK